MKKLLLSIACFSIVLLPVVIAQKAPKKAVYTHDFPPKMTDEVRKAYIELFDKGKVLYEINCSKCHDSVSNGVLCMPIYTKEHLASYNLRLNSPEHEEALSESRVNAEELQNIMIFLTYYKRVDKEGKKK
jgi:hypothetical protein